MKFFNPSTGELVRHDEQRRLLTLPEQTRINILHQAAMLAASHPWAEVINIEKNHQKSVEIVEEFMPKKQLSKAKASASTESVKAVKASTSKPNEVTKLMSKIEEIHNAN